MCVAIFKPKEEQISKEILKRCWESNPHGAGFMYAKDGRIKVAKELTSFKKFLRVFREHEKSASGCDVVVHFRIMTHGVLDYRNTHPHRVNNETWLVHNGIIDEHCYKNAKLSDTVKFCKMLAGLPRDFMNNPATVNLIGGYIDTDKLILLNTRGESRIINEELGVWDNGIWYSNQSYEKPKVTKWSYGGYNYGNYSNFNLDDACLFCNKQLTQREQHFQLCEQCETHEKTRVTKN